MTAALEVSAPPVVSSDGESELRPVGRYVWTPFEVEQLDGVSAGLKGRTVAVVGGCETDAAAIVAQLRQAGARALWLPPTAGPVEAEVDALLATAGRLDGIIDLNLEVGAEDWRLPFAQSLALLRGCFADWVTESDANRLFYAPVTRMGGQMGFGADGATNPLGGLWAGLAKGLPREIPNCNIRIVDLPPELGADPAASLVCRELYRWGLFEIGLYGGRRVTLRARPEPAGPPLAPLRPSDVVIMSGGARGIGFELALHLARTRGCRVIVSGRAVAPDPSDPALTMAEEDFRQLRARRLRQAAAEHSPVTAVRAEFERLTRDRNVLANLRRARSEHADIRYVQCDITSAADVVRLLDQAGGPIAGIIHNAGLDLPARLPVKQPAAVEKVVSVKVEGFRNLLAAMAGRPAPRFFCNVGSLTGRWGGMVGQLDYGAANEALSRLGLAAGNSLGAASPNPLGPDARSRPGPRTRFMTLCWPTWDRLGMITNFQATLRYMSALGVAEGVRHWQRELDTAGRGEVTFIGDVGSALVPVLLRGYPSRSALPGIDRMSSALFFLGEPTRFRPYQEIASRIDVPGSRLPCCHDFRIEGMPALPVSVCVEHLLAAGAWILPDGRDDLVATELRDLRLDLAGLVLPDGAPVTLVKQAAGDWQGTAWRVLVSLWRDGVRFASADVRYQSARSEPLIVDWDAIDGVPVRLAEPPPRLPLHWTGQVFRLARWVRREEVSALRGSVEADEVSDAFAGLARPVPAIGFNVMESIVRGAYLAGAPVVGGRKPTTLQVDRIQLDGRGGTSCELTGDGTGRRWQARSLDGATLVRVTGIHFR